MKDNCIRSYPFTGCSFEKIKRIGDRVSIIYFSNGEFDVYFNGEVVDGNVRNILCYFLFLTRQIDKFNKLKNSYSTNTYLDTILMSINEFVSLGKKNNVLFNENDILLSMNQDSSKYRYFSSVIDMLMNDCYCIDVYSTDSCIKYEKMSDGNLSDIVLYVLDNEYGFGKIKVKTKACIQQYLHAFFCIIFLGDIMVIEVNNFNLHDTVTCGQIFRFREEPDNSYTVILSDRVVNLKQDGNRLYIDSNNMDDIDKVIRNYFDLDFDYDSINKEFLLIDSNDKPIIDSCVGFKMINEPKFEVCLSYILSANNGVPQIRNSLNNISSMFGEKIVFRGEEFYLFPSIDKLKNASVSDFRNCKAGFRDKYLYEFVSKVSSGEVDLDLIDSMSSVDALKYLMSNKGIGEKVASCILLFGYHRFDVFPIDTWVKKYMKDKYNFDSISDIRKFMFDKYSNNCGLAIQYIYHYSRNKKNIL